MAKSRDADKKQASAEPRWVGLLALLAGFAAYMVIFGILLDEIPHPLGTKNEGLLFSLVLYLPIRILFRAVFTIKSRKNSKRSSTHEV